MSLTQIALTTNKTVSNVGDYVRKIGQGERGQVLPVIVTDANGAAYDLTGKSIIFSENKDSGKFVVDDGKSATSGTFDITDPTNGEFSYTLQDQVYTESGTAWFDIVSADGMVIDTTVPFRFAVISSETINVTSSSYVSTLEALQANYQAVINNAETNTQNTINSLNNAINQAISNGQNQLADQLTKLLMSQYVMDCNNQLVHDTTIDFNNYLSETRTIKLRGVVASNGPYSNTATIWGWLTTYYYDTNTVIQEFRDVTPDNAGSGYWRVTSSDASKAWTWHKYANQEDIDSLNNHNTDIYNKMSRYMFDYNNTGVSGVTIDFNDYLHETRTVRVGNVKANNGPYDNTVSTWGWLTTYHYDVNSVIQEYRDTSGDVYWRLTNESGQQAFTWHKRANQEGIDSLNNSMNQYVIDYNNNQVNNTTIDFNNYLNKTQTIRVGNVNINNGPRNNTPPSYGWLTTYHYDTNTVIQEYRDTTSDSDGDVYWRKTNESGQQAYTWHKRAKQEDIDSLNQKVSDLTNQINYIKANYVAKS